MHSTIILQQNTSQNSQIYHNTQQLPSAKEKTNFNLNARAQLT